MKAKYTDNADRPPTLIGIACIGNLESVGTMGVYRVGTRKLLELNIQKQKDIALWSNKLLLGTLRWLSRITSSCSSFLTQLHDLSEAWVLKATVQLTVWKSVLYLGHLVKMESIKGCAILLVGGFDSSPGRILAGTLVALGILWRLWTKALEWQNVSDDEESRKCERSELSNTISAFRSNQSTFLRFMAHSHLLSSHFYVWRT